MKTSKWKDLPGYPGRGRHEGVWGRKSSQEREKRCPLAKSQKLTTSGMRGKRSHSRNKTVCTLIQEAQIVSCFGV